MNLYDIIALLCFKITSLDNVTQHRLYKEFCSNLNKGKNELYNNYPLLDAKNYTEEPVLYDSFSEDEYDDLVNCINSSQPPYLFLLSCLDSLINFDKSLEKFLRLTSLDVRNFRSLNSNVKKCQGMLIPRIEPKWKKENERKIAQLSENPLSIMKNYIWVKNDEKINTWEINNVYSKNWKYDGSGSYKIVCSPLIDTPTFSSDYIDGDINYFNITGYNKNLSENVINRIKATLDYAEKHNADIALFPELIMAPEGNSVIKRWIKENWDRNFPKIICLPSSEYKSDGEWINQTQIINDTGNLILKYNKKQAFKYEKKKNGIVIPYFEPITPDYKTTIIHGDGIGRIGIIICADIFYDDLIDILLNKYEINILLILAYSSGYDRFQRSISKANDCGCEVVWCNCCAAYHSDKEEQSKHSHNTPVAAYYAYGHSTKKEYVEQCSCEHCCGCMMLAEIKPSYKINEEENLLSREYIKEVSH